MLSRLQSAATSRTARYIAGTTVVSTVALTSAYYALIPEEIHYTPIGFQNNIITESQVPSRNDSLNKIKSTKQFDVLVIGGGATGTGVALDAVTRGMSCVLVERDDFASGTSSRSTKLIHGGVRYLEKAVKNLDKGQLHLVKDALRERKHLLNIAPHLSNPLPIIVPFYNSFPSILFYGPYYWAGVKAYDFFAGQDGILEPSYFISRREAREKFPMLKEKGLKGGVVYFDGQHNDSRMNLGIALTAAAYGAAVVNHTEVTGLIKNTSGRIIGAHVRDLLNGEQYDIHAKHVVNATGPFCDAIRKMANDKNFKNMIAPSSGVHVVLSSRYSPPDMGLIVPATEDGRVLFLLPWEGSTIAGTTDSSTEITALPRPHEDEIQFILKETSRFLNRKVNREDVDAAWSGIRPLAIDPNAKDTASTSRDHVVESTAPGMVTITGGKWTTYRKMAEDALERVLSDNAQLSQNTATKSESTELTIDQSKLRPSCSIEVQLVGSAGWSLQMPDALQRQGLSKDIAEHLSHTYGDRAYSVMSIAENDSKVKLNKLADGYPFLEAEVLYACRNEYAYTAVDVISQRIRLAFLNSDKALQALPRVIQLMSDEFQWDTERRVQEYQRAVQFINTMNRKGRKQNLIDKHDKSSLRAAEKRIQQGMSYI